MAQLFKILSLDGGGIRGLVPAMMLAEIERRTGKPVSELFDLIAGTSTGGILSLGLTRPNADGKPTFSAEELIEIYERKGDQIFHTSFVNNLSSLWGVLDEKYESAGLEQLLTEYFGDTKISEALTDILITSYDIHVHRPWFFKSRRARRDPEQDFLMRNVARSTSAAPTFFEPNQLIKTIQNEKRAASLIDGGVMANNPSMCAFAEAKVMLSESAATAREASPAPEAPRTRSMASLYEEEKVAASLGDNERMLVASIGTGEYNEEIAFQRAKKWGMIGWVQPLIDIMFIGASYTIDFQLQQLLPETPGGAQRYFRFQSAIEKISVDMDNVSPENIAALKRTGQQMIKEQSEELDKLCKQLT